MEGEETGLRRKLSCVSWLRLYCELIAIPLMEVETARASL